MMGLKGGVLMNINQVETRTGLERATVRYYEAQGLLCPAREPNGYRNYSEADVEKLEKIRLLRALDFSVEDIRSMDADGSDFPDRLRARLKSLEAREADLADARRVLNRMLEDGAGYGDLDAGVYLAALENRPEALPEPEEKEEPEKEKAPDWPVASPWRRYFARTFDLTLLSFLFEAVLEHLLRIPATDIPIALGAGFTLNGFGFLDLMFTLLALLLLEPVLLRVFGTTPGKWILGLRVRDPRGEKLSWRQGLNRTVMLVFYGLGLRIPLIAHWRLYRSWREAKDGDELPWEEESRTELVSNHWLRTAAYVLCVVLVANLAAWSDSWAGMPRHRGAVTPKELAENFNDYERYRDGDVLSWTLRPDGRWMEDTASWGTVTVYSVDWFRPEDLELRTENGVVTGLRYVQSERAQDGSFSTFSWSGLVARGLLYSLVGADREACPGPHEVDRLLEGFDMSDPVAVVGTYGDWTVTWELTCGQGEDGTVRVYDLALDIARTQ